MSSTSVAGIYAACITLPVLSTTVVALRIYVRRKSKVQLVFDDWIQLPSLLLFLALAVVGLVGVTGHAFGYPDPPGDEEHTDPTTSLVQKCMLATYLITSVLLTLIKISALSFYRRIFCVHNNTVLNYLIISLIVIQVLWSVIFLSWTFAVCGPHLSYIWKGGEDFVQYCAKLAVPYDDAYAISDWILDVFVLLIPLPPIWHLRLPTAKKLAVSFAFMLALLGFGASTARLAVWLELAYGAHGNFGAAQVDMQLSDTQAFWFAILEAGCTLISVNLPSLWGHISRNVPELYCSLRSWSDSMLLRVSRGSSSASRDTGSSTRGHKSSEKSENLPKPYAVSESDISIRSGESFIEDTARYNIKQPRTSDVEESDF